jgi:hypothetical protein
MNVENRFLFVPFQCLVRNVGSFMLFPFGERSGFVFCTPKFYLQCSVFCFSELTFVAFINIRIVVLLTKSEQLL